MELRVAEVLNFRALALAPLTYNGSFEMRLWMARAAIRAIREPTKAMLDARLSALEPHYIGDGVYVDPADCTWKSMIDAASPPETVDE